MINEFLNSLSVREEIMLVLNIVLLFALIGYIFFSKKKKPKKSIPNLKQITNNIHLYLYEIFKENKKLQEFFEQVVST